MTDANRPLLTVDDVGDRVRCGFRFDSNEADIAIAGIVDHEWLNLVGLHCEVGSLDHEFVSYRALIGDMITEMARVRRNHGIALTRLGLDCDVWISDRGTELRELAAGIDEAVDVVCAALRFPRPRVLISTGTAILKGGETS